MGKTKRKSPVHHSVRSHPRKVKSGKVTNVRQHIRGSGTTKRQK